MSTEIADEADVMKYGYRAHMGLDFIRVTTWKREACVCCLRLIPTGEAAYYWPTPKFFRHVKCPPTVPYRFPKRWRRWDKETVNRYEDNADTMEAYWARRRETFRDDRR